jgi:hypothetical protein
VDSKEVTNEKIGMIITERSPHLHCFTSTPLSTNTRYKKNSKRTQKVQRPKLEHESSK